MKSMHDWAAQEANHTGKKVYCNGVNYVPNKRPDIVANIGIALLYIGVGFSLLVIFFGLLVVLITALH